MLFNAAGVAAKQSYTDKDIIDFLTNVECLEGLFDTWGTFGQGFINNLELGGPKPIGAQKAALTEQTLRFLQEVALNEQVTPSFPEASTRQWPPAILCFNSNLACVFAVETLKCSQSGNVCNPLICCPHLAAARSNALLRCRIQRQELCRAGECPLPVPGK